MEYMQEIEKYRENINIIVDKIKGIKDSSDNESSRKDRTKFILDLYGNYHILIYLVELEIKKIECPDYFQDQDKREYKSELETMLKDSKVIIGNIKRAFVKDREKSYENSW